MTNVLTVAEVKRLGRLAGFDLVGIARAEPLVEEFERYRAWIEAGRHGSMAYLERNAALCANPRKLLPEARSIIACGLSYLAPEPVRPTVPTRNVPHAASVDPSLGSEFTLQCALLEDTLKCELRTERSTLAAWGTLMEGAISRYAWGRDYHNVVRKRLKRLQRLIEQSLGRPVRARVCVDSAPLLERSYAARAGLGWIGRNTCLIHPLFGSFLFLGELLVELDLEPDRPMADHCGRCERCLAACPTGALRAPRTLDARRCVSYLTIEHRGPIDPALAPLVGPSVFGCDACQDACPWNVRAQVRLATAVREFHANPRLAGAAFADLPAITEPEFETFFAHSPIRRAGWEGWRRNIEGASKHFVEVRRKHAD